MKKTVIAAVLLAASLAAHATDGVIEINQARALAGGVTPGDTAGFPVTISQPGSYRLTGNLTVPDENTDGIVVTATDVTLDLNGFAIIGPVNCGYSNAVTCTPAGGTGNGISTSGFINSVVNLAILNGTIRGMGGDGIYIGSAVFGGTVDRVRVIWNGGSGIDVASATLVTNSLATRNRYYGILGAGANNFQSNLAFLNGYQGIAAISGAYGGNVAAGNASGDTLPQAEQTTGNYCLDGSC